MSQMSLAFFLFILTSILCVLISPGSAEAYVGWGENLNNHLMASCIRNSYTENYKKIQWSTCKLWSINSGVFYASQYQGCTWFARDICWYTHVLWLIDRTNVGWRCDNVGKLGQCWVDEWFHGKSLWNVSSQLCGNCRATSITAHCSGK